MSVRYSRYIPLIASLGDFAILNLIFIGAGALFTGWNFALSQMLIFFYIYLNITWLLLSFTFKAHQITPDTLKKVILFRYIRIIVFFFFLFLIFFQVTSVEYVDRDNIKYLFGIFSGMILLWKYSLYFAFHFYRKMGYNYRNVLILGHHQTTIRLKDYFVGSYFNGYRFLGFIDDQVNVEKSIIGTWKDLRKMIDNLKVDELYLFWSRIPKDHQQSINEIVTEYPVKVRIVPELGDFAGMQAELINYHHIPVIQIHPGPLSFWYNRFIKRIFDLVISAMVILCFLSWFIPVVFIISFFNSKGGLFFRQKRTGLNGKSFYCLKFRSMYQNLEADVKQATREDDRVTALGRFLRKTSLDEMPQFLNVFYGHMSVVGPRPHMLRHTEEYRKLARRFMLRHAVKPGITGLAQVNGFRGEILHHADLTNRVNLDVKYVENWSVGLDIRIIFLTIKEVIKGQSKAY